MQLGSKFMPLDNAFEPAVMSDVTLLLLAMDRGEPSASDRLLELVYNELREVAAASLARERAGHTLVPTALVHETYLRLMSGQQPHKWTTRGHFFAAAAEAMRRILVDHARRKLSQKRGGHWQRSQQPLDSIAAEQNDLRLLELDDALTDLEKRDAKVAQLVKLRYFSGMTIEDAAAALDVSPRTAVSWWTYARTFLATAMQADEDNQHPRPDSTLRRH